MTDTLILRPIKPIDVEPATQCGLDAWCGGILPLLDGFGALDILRIERLFHDFLLAGIETKNDQLIVADLEGQILGFYCLETRTGELTDLWLAPQWHGKGIATRMFGDAKERSRRAGREELKLKVLVGNQRALAFYRKEGMEEAGRQTAFDAALQQRLEKIIMRLRLDG